MADDDDGATNRRADDQRIDAVGMVVASLKEVITSLREEIRLLSLNEKTTRRRTYGVLATVGVAVLLVLGQARSNHAQGRDIRHLVEFIESCQNPDGECSQRNADRLGSAVKAVSVAVFDSVTCVLLQDPAARTDASIAECRDRHFPK